MVRSGYTMIPEAKQIDDLLGFAWHRVVNYCEPDIAEWQTEAAFAGKYELTMTVRVRIDRRSGRVTEVIGEPHFYFREIAEIINSHGAKYRPANGREFGLEQWRQVVRAKRDFSVIGIALDRNNPIPGFDRYQNRDQNGIRMSANESPSR